MPVWKEQGRTCLILSQSREELEKNRRGCGLPVGVEITEFLFKVWVQPPTAFYIDPRAQARRIGSWSEWARHASTTHCSSI
jgi:hypothetical protein